MQGLMIESILVHPYNLSQFVRNTTQGLELMMALGEREKERREGKKPRGKRNGSGRDRESRRKGNRVLMFGVI